MNALTPLMPSDMDQAIRLAKAMSSAKMLPKHLQDDIGTCLMIVEQAMRWGMSPFAVAQCTSSIGGKLMFEGKLVAAAVESSGTIEGRFDYAFSGEGDDRQVTVSARRKGETNDRQLTIKLRDVRTNNEHWKKQPDQMLVYSSTRNWARRYTPAVLLGVYSPEEFNRDGKPTDDFVGTTLDARAETPEPPSAREQINEEVPMKAAAAPMPRAPRVAEAKPTLQRTNEQWRAWIDKLRSAAAVLYRREEVVELGNRQSVGDAIANAPAWARNEISAILAENYARFPEEDPPEPEEDAPEIKGEEKVFAG